MELSRARQSPRDLAAQLRAAGHDAEHVYDDGLRGLPDSEIFDYAQKHTQSTLTGDIGFGNPLQFSPPHHGVAVARLPDTLSIGTRLTTIMDGLAALAGQPLDNALVVVEVGRARIHR